MTNLRQAAQQALEALKKHGAHTPTCDHLMLLTSLPPQRKPCSCGLATAITALRAALAEREQEPVASLMTNIQSGDQKVVWNDDGFDRALWHETPLYTAPTPRKPLSDEQIMSIDVLRYHFALNGGAGPISKKGKEIIDAIERAHGIGEQT